MHDCPECGQACDCDGEDVWHDTPLNCCHDCDEYYDNHDGVGFEYEFFDGEQDDDPIEDNLGDNARMEDIQFWFKVDDYKTVTLHHNLVMHPLTLVKGLGMKVEDVTKDMVWEVMRYSSTNGAFISFGQTFKELYEEACEFRDAMMDPDYSDERYNDNYLENEVLEEALDQEMADEIAMDEDGCHGEDCDCLDCHLRYDNDDE